MWPCNSIIIAFVWFVTHGKWTQNFQCGCHRILFKISYSCRFHWMESQREWVSSSQCLSDPGAVMDLGQWWCPWRAPGRLAQDCWHTPAAPEPRKCLPVKRSCSTILVCSLLGCFASQWVFSLHQWTWLIGHESSSYLGCAFTHLGRRSGITWSVDLRSQFSSTASQAKFSMGLPRSISPCSAPHHPSACCSMAGALKHTQEIVSQQHQERHEFL